MKISILIGLLASALAAPLSAQDAADLTLSAKPTTQELTMLFFKTACAKVDPFVALPLVIQCGDNTVDGLAALLSMDSLAVQPTTPADSAIVEKYLTTGRPDPRYFKTGSDIPIDIAGDRRLRNAVLHKIKLYAAMGLEGIGTKAAYGVLFQVVQAESDLDVKAVSLNALATSFHSDEYLQRFKPDKELIHLFLKEVDDTTATPYLQTSLGLIARKGLVLWFGMDAGEPQGGMKRLLDAQGKERGSLADYREEWWQANQSLIYWDDQTDRFNKK